MLEMMALIGLATYRLWRLAAHDVILDRPRDWIYDRAERSSTLAWLVEMASCVWCLGFWIAGALTAVAALSYDWSTLELLLVWLAASATAGFAKMLDPSVQ